MLAWTFLVLLLGCSSTYAGTVWPKPLNQSRSTKQLYVDQTEFRFVVSGFDSGILQSALSRYIDILFDCSFSSDEDVPINNSHQHFISALKVHIASNDQSLNLETDESYVLDISAPESSLSANTVFGALHGLESFSQLLDRVNGNSDPTDAVALPGYDAGCEACMEATEGHPDFSDGQDGDEAFDEFLSDSEPDEGQEEGKHKKKKKHDKKKKKKHKHKKHHHHHHHHKQKASHTILDTYIWDAPRFKHRGLLLDTARHFLPVPVILEHLDAMAWSKLNVLHWHIVDDQSFPFVSTRLPLLAEKGAFAPGYVYSPEDVQDIVRYAKDRGIRVVPEFDTPGHTLSWGRGYPDLLTDCYDERGQRTGRKGPLNPARNETYELLWTLLQELAAVFPDSYVHLGGDEVPFDCWLNNPEIKAWMAEQDPEIRSMPELEEYFERRVLDLAAAAGRSYIVWQEILDNNVQVQDDTVVHVWKWWWPTGDSAAHWSLSGSPPPGSFLAGEGAAGSSSLKSFSQRFWGMVSDVSRIILAAVGVQEYDSGSGEADDPPAWVHEMERVTSRGYRTLLSSPWYLNLGGFASNDWARYYSVEPLGFQASREQKELVIGGEACVWGEFVDATNSIQRTWPRAAAVAERLWSDSSVRDLDDAFLRLSELRCKMKDRGVAAEPLGPGFCP